MLFALSLEAGDHVEEFLVNSALTQAMEVAVEVLQQFVNVAVRALHRGQMAGVFAGEGFGGPAVWAVWVLVWLA